MRQKTSLFVWILLVLSCWKLTLHSSFGSHHISFSCLSIVLPLIGAFLSKRTSSLWSMSGWGLAHLAHLPITMGIPTFFATLSWGASSRRSQIALHILLPCLCMILFYFVAAPGSWPYALYWLIPVVLYFFPRSLPCSALQSTFVAHAIGSVIWAYFIPMSSSAWLGLIPIVAIERLAMATLAASMVWILKGVENLSETRLSFAK